MDKLNRILIVILLIIFLVSTIACKQQELQTSGEQPKDTPTPQKKTLSDLQTTACNAADKAGTCNTRLVEIGIVSPEQCCSILQKCC